MVNNKLRISILAGIIFFIVSSPYVYNLTDKYLSGIVGQIAVNGCPTELGLALHTVVYILITRLMMR